MPRLVTSLRRIFKEGGERDGDRALPADTDAAKAGAVDFQRARAAAVRSCLLDQSDDPVKGGAYWETQIAFGHDSNSMEGVQLSESQARTLFEDGRITGEALLTDALVVANHFRLFDHMLATVDQPLAPDYIRRYQGILFAGSGDSDTGSWKALPNGVGNVETVPPSAVGAALARLTSKYEASSEFGYLQLAAFHAAFERVHPLQDGNGRVGRMLLFKEALRHGLLPPLVADADKKDYYLALVAAETDIRPLAELLERLGSRYYLSVEPLIPDKYLETALDRR